jgi:FkbM family methyltransferase
VSSRSEHGWLRGLYRVARSTSSPAPSLVKLPERWSADAPLVRSRRLGLQLHLDLRDNLQRTLFFTGTYEPGLLRFLHDELRCGDVAVDVGAHIGVHALTMSRRLQQLGGGCVFAFEPARDSAAMLRAAATHNRLGVTVVELALGREPGTTELFADAAYDLADAGVRSQFGTGRVVQQVAVTTFDLWAEQAHLDRLDVVKLDVEGAEPLVLEGMRASLRRLRPRLVVVEVKARVLERSGANEAGLRELLASCAISRRARSSTATSHSAPPTRPPIDVPPTQQGNVAAPKLAPGSSTATRTLRPSRAGFSDRARTAGNLQP